MIASLPMYWRAENADAWLAMWRDVQAAGRAQGVDLPDLTTPDDIPDPWSDHWLRDDLILSQTCSLPFRTALRDQVTYVGTLDFGLTERPGHYHSQVLTSQVLTGADGDTTRLALNGYDSQSGWAATQAAFAGDAPVLSALAKTHLITGAHSASMRAVAEGAADAACIDGVTWRLCQTYDPEAAAVTEAGTTRPTPGLPLITARHQNPEPLRALFKSVFAANPAWLGAPALGGLRDFVVLAPAAYLSLPIPDIP